MWRALLFGLVACGRFGFDDASVNVVASADAAPDATPVCPVDTAELAPGSAICIEKAQRSETWTNAKGLCEAAGRRLCADAEWALACENAVGLVSMVGPDWEWVAEEAGGVAQKRGFSACSDTSSHEIFVDPYEFRCCVEK